VGTTNLLGWYRPVNKAQREEVAVSYYLDLFSPETYQAFGRSDQGVSGFRPRQQNMASRVRKGDKLLCYLTQLSRWVGMLTVADGPFRDDTPLFYLQSDPFVIRFRVKALVWLPVEKAIPIHEASVWNALSFTKGHDQRTSSWTGKVRASLVPLSDQDGALLERLLVRQAQGGKAFPLDAADRRKMTPHRVRREDKDVTVTVPEESLEDDVPCPRPVEARESTQIQAVLADIGHRMGMKVWLPRADRNAVLSEWKGDHDAPLERLPLNYDEATLRTIEQIDVIWLRGRSIRRAFEVEHTTSVYSGLLRMADLLALQPNMDIKLHIVAPASRREKVLQELQRPVFSLLERGPLSESCTYLSYDSLRELERHPNWGHLKETVLEEYAEGADE
jgi:hypothetical protein